MEKKKKKKKKNIYNVIIFICIVVIIIAGYFILKDIIPRIRNMKQIDSIQQIGPLQSVKDSQSVIDIGNFSFAGLKEINSDIIAWIYIDGTNVNLPVLQASDNDYYLYVSYLDEYSGAGSIFLDAQNNPDFTDQNSVVYGHAMIDKTMFGTLSRYKKQDFYEQHPYIVIITDEGITYYYHIFSVNIFEATADYRQSDYNDYFLDFVSDLRASSLINSDVDVNADSKIITLSTCTDAIEDGRLVVFGVLVNPNGEPVVSE